MKKRKFDFIIITLLLLFAGISWILVKNIYQSEGDYIEIMVDGKVERTLPLSENIEYVISKNSCVNIVEIKEGKVNMKSADCPDKLCVKQGEINQNGQSIICLPNKIVIRIINNSEADIDAYVN